MEQAKKELEQHEFWTWYAKLPESDKINILQDYWKAHQRK